MNTLIYISEHWKQIGEGLEVVGANVYAIYAFVSNHGGYRSMWANFRGPKETMEDNKKEQNEKVNP